MEGSWVETEIGGIYFDPVPERYGWSECMAGKKSKPPFPPKKGKPGAKMPMKGMPMKGAKCQYEEDAYLWRTRHGHFKCMLEIPLHSELCLER